MVFRDRTQGIHPHRATPTESQGGAVRTSNLNSQPTCE